MQCLVILILLFLSSVSVFASNEPPAYPSNRGGTGLMEIPTARVMKENSLRIGVSQIKPYRYYYGAISPLNRLEINGRITEVTGVPALTASYGDFKDKAISLKYQFISEGKYIPALAAGIMDPHGTRVYPSQYVVVSKQIYPFDFTLGFGNGIFGKRPLSLNEEEFKLEILSNPGEWIRDSQFFWGVQFAPSEKFALMFEYSPIRYHVQAGDPARDEYFREPVSSRYNFGIRYKPTGWSAVDLSYQRGNQIGVNLSMIFDIGKPLIPIYNPSYREKPEERLSPISERITRVLYYSGFSDIVVVTEQDELWIEAQNEKYYFNSKAIGIIMEAIIKIIPENTEKVHIILKENGIPVIGFKTTKTDITELYSGKLTVNEFFYLSGINTDISRTIDIQPGHRKSFRYGIKPSFETFLNDPSGFFQYRFGVSGWLSYHPWKGASFIAGAATYPLNNISTVNEPLSIPVRSDLVLYKQEKIVLDRLMFDQIKRLTPKIYAKASAGFLEVQYAGIDAEVAMPVLDGRIFLGLSGSAVKKRYHNKPFGLINNDVKDIYTTAFLNTRLNIHEKDIAIDIKAGRFLAGDNGVRFTLSKSINGVTIWAWYSITDTSVFNDKTNRGYRDKGIGISIPLRLFKGTDSRTAYNYAISPWTRDTGQDIEHYGTLFDFIGRDTGYEKTRRHMLY